MIYDNNKLFNLYDINNKIIILNTTVSEIKG